MDKFWKHTSALKWLIASTLLLWGVITVNEAFGYEITLRNDSQYAMVGTIFWVNPTSEWSPNGAPVAVMMADLEPGQSHALTAWDDVSRQFIVRWLLSHTNQFGNRCPDKVLFETYQHLIRVPQLSKNASITISQIHVEDNIPWVPQKED